MATAALKSQETYFDHECEKDLRAWGRRNKMSIYQTHVPKCIWGGLAKYGIRIGPTIYVQETVSINPAIDLVDKVYAFMPEDRMKAAIFLYYSMSTNKSWCARRMKEEGGKCASREVFNYWLRKAREFYAEYRDSFI